MTLARAHVMLTSIVWVAHPEERRGRSRLQREIVEYLRREGRARLGVIAGALPSGASRRAVQRDLYRLRDAGVIDCEGVGRGAFWIIRGHG
jgi:DNA-binding transcriptional ArsR family regulator